VQALQLGRQLRRLVARRGAGVDSVPRPRAVVHAFACFMLLLAFLLLM
jgi:hypothetical protein